MKNYCETTSSLIEITISAVSKLGDLSGEHAELLDKVRSLEDADLAKNDLAVNFAKALIGSVDKLEFLRREQEYALLQLDQMQKELESAYLELFQSQNRNSSQVHKSGNQLSKKANLNASSQRVDSVVLRLVSIARKQQN